MKKSKMMERYEQETGNRSERYIMVHVSVDGYGYGELVHTSEYVAWLESLATTPTPNLTPAQENAYNGSTPSSIHKPIYGVVDTPKNAVQPVFHIGDTIRFKSTGRIEKIGEITHGGRFVNSVDVNDVEKL